MLNNDQAINLSLTLNFTYQVKRFASHDLSGEEGGVREGVATPFPPPTPRKVRGRRCSVKRGGGGGIMLSTGGVLLQPHRGTPNCFLSREIPQILKSW